MDTPQWRSAANERKLIDELRQLNGHLISLSGDLQEIKIAAESIDKTAKSREDKENAQKELVAVLHTPEPVETERKTSNTRTERRDRIRLFVEWATLFAVVAYGYVALRQWREMIQARHQVERAIGASNRTATAAEKANAGAFEANRPWLGAVFSNETPMFVQNSPKTMMFSFMWHFKNAGKRPAIVRQIHTIAAPL